jgi:hypothetical protein
MFLGHYGVGFSGKRAAPRVSLPRARPVLAGLVLYLRGTRARGVAGQVSLWSFVVVILLIYGQGLFGPPPPDERSLAWFALIGWLIPPWGSWIDRTRRSDLA